MKVRCAWDDSTMGRTNIGAISLETDGGLARGAAFDAMSSAPTEYSYYLGRQRALPITT